MARLYPMKNPVQEYAWGSKTAIQELLGQPFPSDTPAAELWLGAHPKAPSEVQVEDGWITLSRLIQKDPVAILGKPNTGKSTLLNRLVGFDRAIVSDIPGTTRDVLESTIEFSGMIFRILDTAGGYVGVKNFRITNLSIRPRTGYYPVSSTSFWPDPVSIDVYNCIPYLRVDVSAPRY